MRKKKDSRIEWAWWLKKNPNSYADEYTENADEYAENADECTENADEYAMFNS
jgi:hypothetical protein